MFEGLSKSDANQLYSYYHMRRPVNPWDKNIVTRSDYNLSLDFLDPLVVDNPPGCWGLQMEKGDTIAVLRNLYWPGLFAYHIVETPHYGWFYSGYGKKNWDVPFMVSDPDQIEEMEQSKFMNYPRDYDEEEGEDENN